MIHSSSWFFHASEECFSIKFQLEDVSNDRRHRDDAALPGGREDLAARLVRWDRCGGTWKFILPLRMAFKTPLLINQIQWNPISRVGRSSHSIRLTPIVDGLNPILNKKTYFDGELPSNPLKSIAKWGWVTAQCYHIWGNINLVGGFNHLEKY